MAFDDRARMRQSGRTCRGTLSSHQFAQSFFALPINQCGDGSRGCLTLIDPDAVFFLELRLGTDGPQGDDFLAQTVEFQSIARAEALFLPQRFGNENPPGPIKSKLGGHVGERQ